MRTSHTVIIAIMIFVVAYMMWHHFSASMRARADLELASEINQTLVEQNQNQVERAKERQARDQEANREQMADWQRAAEVKALVELWPQDGEGEVAKPDSLLPDPDTPPATLSESRNICGPPGCILPGFDLQPGEQRCKPINCNMW